MDHAEELVGLLSGLRVDEEELDEPDLSDLHDDAEFEELSAAQAAHTSTLANEDAGDIEDATEIYLSSEPAEPPENTDRGGATNAPRTSCGTNPFKSRTKRYRAHHEANPGSLETAVLSILAYMRALRVDLPLLLWAISYSIPELVTNTLVKAERTALLSSSELLPLLRVWHKPPRSHSKGVRSKGASDALDVFALERIISITRKEMAGVGTYMRTKPSDLSAETLLSIKIPDMKRDVKARAPTLWTLLRKCAWTPRQEKQNTLKDPDATVLYMISMASFTRSNRNNTLQGLTAVYLKSCGTSAKAFDTFSAIGMTMSQKWTYSAIEQLSESEHASLQVDLKRFPWFGSHDNVNFKFRVFEQRSDHQSHFDSGTAGTIFVIKDPEAVPPSAANLRAHRLLTRGRPLISAAEVFALEADASPRLATRALDKILHVLLGTPGFSLDTYKHHAHPLLKPAPRPGQLTSGSRPKVRQYVLDTVHIEEASYDGNERVLQEWLRQLKLDTLEEQKRTGRDRVLPWVGDQLTVSRLRGLLRFRRDDCNAFERLEHIIPISGWFHLVFALEQSLHAEYYSTHRGLGLVHSFEVLGRKGLHTTSTQGTFHHTFEEALDHTLQAHIRALWCTVGGVSKLEDLRSRSPEELLALATKIRDEHASTLSLLRLETTKSGLQQKPLDPLHRQVMQFIRDGLDYLILRDAISCGDIHTMQDMLPRLLFRFSGGRNPNYTIEVCEMLQNLHSDWPEDLKAYILKYCWLTNTSGHPNTFHPVDKAMEHVIWAVKYMHGVMGPFASWEYLGKISASIPAQRRVKEHVEREINHGYRGKSHTRPEEENDIAKLQATYQDARIYTPLGSRHNLESADRFLEVMKNGAEAVASGKAFRGWAKGRLPEQRVTDEIWDDADTAEGTDFK